MNVKKDAIKVAGMGSLISAAFASVCCLGPLMLTVFGLGGLGLAAGIEKYRPLFLTLTAVTLGTAFYFAYRKREVSCEDGSCELRSGSRGMKAFLWLIAVLALGMATFPSWSSLLLKPSNLQKGCIQNGQCQ